MKRGCYSICEICAPKEGRMTKSEAFCNDLQAVINNNSYKAHFKYMHYNHNNCCTFDSSAA